MHALTGNTTTHSFGELHDQFLNSLDESSRAMARTLLEKAMTPPDPGFCRARVYAGAAQCRRKPLSGTHFCREHSRVDLRAKHGLQGNPLPLPDLHARILALVKKVTKASTQHSGFKWYSRHRLWLFAESLGLSGIAALSDDEFLRGLETVSTYFTKHAPLRQNLQLHPFAGPQVLADRGSDKEQVLGNLKLFPYYDRALFVAELQGLSAHTTVATACERDFMQALRATSNRMRNWAMLRGLDGVSFQGPQSYAHKDHLDRLNFSVTEVLAPKQSGSGSCVPSGSSALARPLHTLKCDKCGKLRRVDNATFLLYHPSTWEQDALQSATTDLLLLAPSLKDFKTSVGPSELVVVKQHLQSFLVLCQTSLQRCALLHYLLTTFSELQFSDEVHQLYDDSFETLCRPHFNCAFLVDTACETDDDLQSLATPPALLAACAPSQNEPLLVFHDARPWHMPYAATLRRTTRYVPPHLATSDSSCSVYGCSRQFDRDHRRTAVWNPARRTALRVHGVCAFHYMRLARSKAKTADAWLRALWTPAELEANKTRACSSSQLQRCRLPEVESITLTLRFHRHPHCGPGQDVTYELCSNKGNAFLWQAK